MIADEMSLPHLEPLFPVFSNASSTQVLLPQSEHTYFLPSHPRVKTIKHHCKIFFQYFLLGQAVKMVTVDRNRLEKTKL